jgi:hypothetical protein
MNSREKWERGKWKLKWKENKSIKFVKLNRRDFNEFMHDEIWKFIIFLEQPSFSWMMRRNLQHSSFTLDLMRRETFLFSLNKRNEKTDCFRNESLTLSSTMLFVIRVKGNGKKSAESDTENMRRHFRLSPQYAVQRFPQLCSPWQKW